MKTMLHMLRFWGTVVVGVMLSIPVGSWALYQLKGADGALGTPVVLCDSFLNAGFVAVIASGWFLILALAAAKLTQRYAGLLVYGVSWMLVARQSVAIDEVMRQIVDVGQSPRGVLFMFAVETAVWFIPVGVLLFLLSRGPFANPDAEEVGPQTKLSARAFGMSCVAGIILCWLAARTDLKGQALYGSMAAFAAATMGVRLTRPRCHGLILFFMPLVVGVFGLLLASMMVGDDVLRVMADGHLFPLARPLPMDYSCAGVVGVVSGIYLAHSFGAEPAHHSEEETTNASAAG